MTKNTSTHVTRFSDSSFFDEVCVLCGTTDERPTALNGTCHVGASFRMDQHKIVYDCDSRTKVRCKLCGNTEHLDLQGPCRVFMLMTPVCEEVPSVKKEPTPVVMDMTPTPYGDVAGPAEAIKYVRELVSDDTTPAPQPEHKTFLDELTTLINIHSVENKSNTPDWILARMLVGVLDVYREAVLGRDKFFGISPEPGASGTPAAPQPGEEAACPIFPLPMVETKEKTYTYKRSPEMEAIIRHTPRTLADWDGGDAGKMFIGPDAATWN